LNNSFEKNNFRELIVSNPERQKEIARMGGIRSGEVRRKKANQRKAYRLMLDVTLSQPMKCNDFVIKPTKRSKRKSVND